MEINKTIPVHFDEWQKVQYNKDALTQWDRNQQLEISGLDISEETVEVHFSLEEVSGNATRKVGTVENGVISVKIPAFILEGPEYVYGDRYCAWAWVYVSDEESAETIRKICFTIAARPKQEDYIHTDDELKAYEELEEKINTELDEFRKMIVAIPKFAIKPVDILPTEDISATTIYLLKSGEDTSNLYEEYIYVDGQWELLGQAEVEVDLSDYLNKADLGNGFRIDSLGKLQIHGGNLNEALIKAKATHQIAVTPFTIDLAVKYGLADSQIEWSDEEKASTLELLGGLQKSTKKPLVNAYFVYAINPSGQQTLVGVSYHDIAQQYKIAQYGADGTLSVGTPTADNQATSKKYVDDNFVGKVTDTSTYHQVYGKSADGTSQWCVDYTSSPTAMTIAQRGTGGVLPVGTPTDETHATTKKYVDDLFNSIVDYEEVAF